MVCYNPSIFVHISATEYGPFFSKNKKNKKRKGKQTKSQIILFLSHFLRNQTKKKSEISKINYLTLKLHDFCKNINVWIKARGSTSRL